MTQEQIIAEARDLASRLQPPVLLEPLAIRPMNAARFNALVGREVYRGDFRVVDFPMIMRPGVEAMTPNTVMIEVIPATGEVREIYLGMHMVPVN